MFRAKTREPEKIENYPALHGSSFTQGPHKFNKWHQERLLQMTVKPKAFVDLPNEKYFNIVTDVVKENYVAKLLKWASNINEEHKRGLRLIKTVIDLKGQKRFKKREGAGPQQPGEVNMDSLTAEDAKKIFRKSTTMTSYSKSFGTAPTAQADYNILKNKSLSELPIGSILN